MPDFEHRYDEWNLVMQGLALGCLAIATHRLPASRAKIEPAFTAAWGLWPSAGEFREIEAREFDLFAMRAVRRNADHATWEWGRVWYPVLTDPSGNAAAALEAFAAGGAVPAAAWTELAELFTAQLPQG
jgi:hypothetical protein